ncbi:MAG TPA: hypothetical protein VJ974_04805 [Geopsychrobacteraceae bacterium]|nr:hypothetical protein [Geopsychrobacteraceae bacterium]
MKVLNALCLCLLLTACTPIFASLNGEKQPKPVPSADLRLFTEGVTQLVQNRDTELLLRLQDKFPYSPWTEKATDLLSLAEQITRQEQQLAKLRRQLDQPPSVNQLEPLEKEIDRYKTENLRLQQELDVSNKRLEALRQLTIDLELKQP